MHISWSLDDLNLLQKRVVAWVAKGASNQEIADELHIHVQHVSRVIGQICNRWAIGESHRSVTRVKITLYFLLAAGRLENIDWEC